MDGHLQTEGGTPDRDVYQNVTLYLLSEEGTAISTIPLGDLQADYG